MSRGPGSVSYTHLDVYKRQVYMMASANKFLRIYYASVKAYLESLEHD